MWTISFFWMLKIRRKCLFCSCAGMNSLWIEMKSKKMNEILKTNLTGRWSDRWVKCEGRDKRKEGTMIICLKSRRNYIVDRWHDIHLANSSSGRGKTAISSTICQIFWAGGWHWKIPSLLSYFYFSIFMLHLKNKGGVDRQISEIMYISYPPSPPTSFSFTVQFPNLLKLTSWEFIASKLIIAVLIRSRFCIVCYT